MNDFLADIVAGLRQGIDTFRWQQQYEWGTQADFVKRQLKLDIAEAIAEIAEGTPYVVKITAYDEPDRIYTMPNPMRIRTVSVVLVLRKVRSMDITMPNLIHEKPNP